MKEPIIAFEVGTHKVRALVAEPVDNDVLHIIGLGECMSEGVRKAEIIDLEAATECVGMALARAEDDANITANQIHLVYSSGALEATIQHGSTPINNTAREVTDIEVEEVRSHARARIPLNREIVRSIPQHYYIDDQPGVTNPIGLKGLELKVDMLILHGISSRLENNVLAASGTRAEVLSAEFGGMCCGLSVLTDEQKQRGALVIDMGAGTTDFVSYIDGYPSFAGSLPIGGDHITTDLSSALNVSHQIAEDLKKTKAHATIDLARSGSSFALNPDDLIQTTVHQEDIDKVTHARVEETLEIIRDMLAAQSQHLLQRLSAGVFLTGGGARLQGVTDLAQQIFRTRVQLGIPFGVSGWDMDDEDFLLELAAPIGLLRKVARNHPTRRRRRGIFSKV